MISPFPKLEISEEYKSEAEKKEELVRRRK